MKIWCIRIFKKWNKLCKTQSLGISRKERESQPVGSMARIGSIMPPPGETRGLAQGRVQAWHLRLYRMWNKCYMIKLQCDDTQDVINLNCPECTKEWKERAWGRKQEYRKRKAWHVSGTIGRQEINERKRKRRKKQRKKSFVKGYLLCIPNLHAEDKNR